MRHQESPGRPKPVTVESLAAMLAGRPGHPRTLVAMAGPPGSGKSMAAAALVAQIDAARPGHAALVPMDGFHYDDGVLDTLGLRARKGAPETFDAAGLAHLLGRLRQDDEAQIAIPLFDRALEIARAGAQLVPRRARIVVVEGNYLLLAQPPWRDLGPLFDVTVMLRVADDEVRRRLEQRWIGYGLAPAAIAAKLDGNDLPNARLIASASAAPDYIIAG